jgi:hypothetical protein
LQKDFPHPTIDGEWAKTSSAATASYLIIGFDSDNLDDAIALTKKSRIRVLISWRSIQNLGTLSNEPGCFSR